MTLLALLIGGAAGTGLRLTIDTLLPHGGAAFPLGTVLLNIAGSFALGALVARVWPFAPGWLRVGLGPGLLGSFTTFSALAVSVVELASFGAGWSAALDVAVSMVGGLAAAALGLRLARHPEPLGPDE